MSNEPLYKELSYRIIGLAMEVHRIYGSGHKEVVYQRAMEEKLKIAGIPFKAQPRIPVLSIDSGKTLGHYVPDILIDDRIILELKRTDFPIRIHEIQLRDYLKNTYYELGYVINFGCPSLYFHRAICSNRPSALISQKSA